MVQKVLYLAKERDTLPGGDVEVTSAEATHDVQQCGGFTGVI